MDNEFYLNENYTFTKDSIIDGQVESTITYEFNNKTHISELLNSMLLFLRASGFDYVDRLVAIKADGEEATSDDDVDEDLLDVLNQIVVELDTKKSNKNKNKPDLKVVSINDDISKSTDQPPDST
jgi:predicted site-specific integrase-resolvase